MNVFAVGDIHGLYNRLVELINKLPLKDKDLIVFLGDYIDRGEDSKNVIDFLIKLRAERPKDHTIFLKGNHEALFLDYLNGKNEEIFFINGGRKTIESYSVNGRFYLPDEHLMFFKQLLPYYETENYIFVHAGLKPGVSITCQREEDLLWIRGEFIFSDFNFGKRVIFGHTSMKSFMPYFDKNKIGIDTGAVYGGVLTAIMLPEEKIFNA